MDNNGPSAGSYNNFRVLYLITQMVGATVIVLVGSWIGAHLNGLAWTSRPSVQFNWHPLLMTMGMIFLYGNSILVYRGFRYARKKPLKITHAVIHGLAFIFTVIALVAAFDSHNLAPTPIPNMYTLHSWVGMAAVVLFGLQYVFGFTSYLFPGVRDTLRASYMPVHVFFGVLGFVLAIAASLLGLLEKAIFSISNYRELPAQAVLVNMIGLLLIIYGGLVVFLVTEPMYKRKPLPEDVMLLTHSASSQ
ncbi:plasma membrane ascorbate-dependent reductase CYBRD1 [Topomyia yanbarensis]|uniref:plasma membrane ascorbate-dependent reductase CYBRD1 n=1 Tax=Topomyia yanbarensis TaxID=2498891 RepID=UPI00273CBF48|nr:plasma membrane ascorbate-dependent reductase CYBRD1 [Topomyia yanbarensis]XP_058832800.1 plasma membrane ascorbate-dependent reductase CYBRD1 [Topomyia yanbarensis]XP_058832801.1 plasma membrane ascorbate-dependent reductase CYBRD1 [Topomyia yanbarensis]XP_058832802.1 plasma membrane ascorbate-dependent reductase CYBRD1 [Topomyia yanbarensis]